MTTFVVLLNKGTMTATIAQEGYEPNDGSVHVGSFEMDVNPVNNQMSSQDLRSGVLEAPVGDTPGDHPYVTAAKQVLQTEADKSASLFDVNKVTFLDKASNAPLHPEETGTLDQALPTDDGRSDPDASAQPGGVISTAGTDPKETDPNGVTQADERTDEGETSQTSDAPGSNVGAAPPNPNNGGLPGKPNEGDNAKNQHTSGDTSTETSDEKADDTSEDQSTHHEMLAQSIPNLADALKGVDDPAVIDQLLAAEKSEDGQTRQGAIAALEARKAELTRA